MVFILPIQFTLNKNGVSSLGSPHVQDFERFTLRYPINWKVIRMTENDSAADLLFSKINNEKKVETFKNIIDATRYKNASMLITPNIHHLALLRINPQLREAYEQGHVVLADGWPVALLASIKAKRVITRQTGSDLIPNIVKYNPSEKFRIALLGGFGDAAIFSRDYLENKYPQIEIVYLNTCHASKLNDLNLVQELRVQISACAPDLVVLGLGCPKQELFSNLFLRDLPIGLICNLGATIDFFSGVRSRAPIVVRLIGLEWLFRLLIEPGRLFGRYALGIRHFPYYFFRFVKLSFLTKRK